MFGLDSGVLVLVGLALLILVAAAVWFAPKLFSRAGDDEVHPVHKGKDHAGGCKFNRDEVRRTRLQATPPIDTSNLPAPDPRIVKLLACVHADQVMDVLAGLSGEKSVYVGDQHVAIKSRSTHGEGVYQAMTWLEQYYRSLGIQQKASLWWLPVQAFVGLVNLVSRRAAPAVPALTYQRVPYKVRGKTHFNLEITKPGITNPKRILYLGAHLDSTAGNTWSAEKLAPGADDDGSGTVGMLKIIELIKDLPLDFTVKFVHFTGEEQGLWGSYKYSDAVAAAKEDVIGMIQMDMIGYCANKEHLVDIHDNVDQNGSHMLVVAIVREIARYGLKLTPIDTHNRAVENRSDHAGFLDHGYKAVLVSERFTDEDFTPYYHTVEDRTNKINQAYYVEIIRAILATTVTLAGIRPESAS